VKEQYRLSHLTEAERKQEEQQAREAAKAETARVQQRRESEESNMHLCRIAAACKKYDEARLDCAAAGNLKTCLRIKMGEDVSYAEGCSGYNLGSPAILDPRTPNAVQCFLIQW
jgi:hypothetical protein